MEIHFLGDRVSGLTLNICLVGEMLKGPTGCLHEQYEGPAWPLILDIHFAED